MKPSYKHDCEKCYFVGKVFIALDFDGNDRKVADVYKSCEPFGSGYILRYSSEGSEYISTDNPAIYFA